MSGVNPQGCKVATFKTPSSLERAHDFLWRVHQEAPPKGYIGIFNRSHYEDVLITRVHGWVSDKTVKQRFGHIKDFEELLAENGTSIIKLFLHISKDEQKERLEERIRDPEKRWKFNEGDLEERKLWDRYMRAFEDVMSATSTDHAPWYVVPANRKWYRNLVVADLVVDALTSMKLTTPPAPKGITSTNSRSCEAAALLFTRTEVTSIEKKSLDNSLFAMSADDTKVDREAMMRGAAGVTTEKMFRNDGGDEET